jgi:ribonuclease HI
VESGISLFTGKVLTEQLKFKLDNRCTNSQAEQLAVLKPLEAIETQLVEYKVHKTAVIYTESNITLDLIRSAKNHVLLVEEIRKRTVKPEQKEPENRI